jgi:hypothetical protein
MLDGRLRNYLTGFDRPEAWSAVASGPVIFWDKNMRWALTTDGFWWLEGP